ncbi:MAG: hypothetical protein SPL13_04770, partial [Clostridia bacterium]|nr:hypothetical protein [Clostridia bacterium]
MKFRKIAFILSIIIGLTMLGGCLQNGHLEFGFSKSQSSSSSGGGENGTIFVDLHSLMPSANERPTVDNPNPVNASRNIARAFAAQTGVAVEWASDYGKPTAGLESMRTWFVNQMSVDKCPIIGYSAGTGLQETNWYLDLTEYLERPNKYVEGNERWKDLFEDWVWDAPEVKDANGKIVAIPILLHAGTATAIYYNKSLVSSESANWQEFLNTQYALEAKGVQFPYIPYTGEMTIGLYTWPIRFSISPGYTKKLIDLPLSEGG